jgi:hypothetical protein
VSVPSTSTRLNCFKWVAALLSGVASCGSATAQTRIPQATFLQWGLEIYNKSVDELKVNGSSLFAETASLAGGHSGGSGGYSFVWPEGIQFRVLNSLVEFDPATFSGVQRAFSDELLAKHWRSTRPGGYRSGVPASAELFYDDNGHVAVALADAYFLTGDAAYLTRAIGAYRFILSGEDSVGGGGIYFKENQFGAKETVSTLQAARAALMIYRANGDNQYLADARRLYRWTADTTQHSSGVFWEKFYWNTGQVGDNTLVNAAGMGLSTNLEFYKATGEPSYIVEAQRIANACLSRFFNATTGRLNDQGYWAFELVDGLVDLYELDGNARWLGAVEQALTYLHDHKRDSNSHYGPLWGNGVDQTTVLSSWNLIEQAAVARAYLSLALATPPLTGDFENDSDVDGNDFLIWQRGFGGPGTKATGDADGNGVVNNADLAAWRLAFGGGVVAAAGSVPEPLGAVNVLIGIVACAAAARGPRQRR